MSDPRIERLARVMIGYSLGLKKGDLVLIQAPSLAEPLVVELVRAALDAGANPAVRFSLPGVDHAYLSEATEEHLRFLLPYAVEEDKVEASFRNGVLTVTLPRSTKAEERGRRIPINNKAA